MWSEVFHAYLVTFGWAVVGSVSMGLGVVIAIKLFDIATHGVDEWQLIKDGNIPMAIVLAAFIISLGLVVSAVVHP